MQGGEMAVVSKVNAGSTFSITIPTEAPEGVLDDDPEEIEEEAPTRSTSEIKAVPPAPPQMMAKREVLLIEDNKDMVDQFRRALQREGFEVVTADHPAYAEAMASNLRPTVIVMDTNFAGGKGWDILASLKDRDDTFDIPVVVVTLSDESERAFQTGVHSFIQRPFVPEDLIEAVLEAEKESNTERILIIDDQPDDVRLLKQILNDSGTYRVFTATGGKEGVSLVARRRPDLIILDLRMPEMDGFAVLDELRSNPETANIPIMVVTGEVDLNADEQAILGNVRVVPKSSITETEYQQFVEQIRNELNE
jgi:CheY-like chemotaxis protein